MEACRLVIFESGLKLDGGRPHDALRVIHKELGVPVPAVGPMEAARRRVRKRPRLYWAEDYSDKPRAVHGAGGYARLAYVE